MTYIALAIYGAAFPFIFSQLWKPQWCYFHHWGFALFLYQHFQKQTMLNQVQYSTCVDDGFVILLYLDSLMLNMYLWRMVLCCHWLYEWLHVCLFFSLGYVSVCLWDNVVVYMVWNEQHSETGTATACLCLNLSKRPFIWTKYIVFLTRWCRSYLPPSSDVSCSALIKLWLWSWGWKC